MYPPGRIGCDDTGDDDGIHLSVCPKGLPPEEKTGASGFVSALPYLEEQAVSDLLSVSDGGLWNRNVDDIRWYSNPDKAAGVRQRPPVFVCPSDRSARISDVYSPLDAATGSYAMVQGSLGPDSPKHIMKYENNGVFVYVSQRRERQIRDGLSKTTLVGEVVLADTWESANMWTYAIASADTLRSTRNPPNTPPGTGDATLYRRNGGFASEHPGRVLFSFADGHVQRRLRRDRPARLPSAVPPSPAVKRATQLRSTSIAVGRSTDNADTLATRSRPMRWGNPLGSGTLITSALVNFWPFQTMKSSPSTVPRLHQSHLPTIAHRP